MPPAESDVLVHVTWATSAHVTRTRTSLSRSKVQRSTCRGRRHIVAASRTANFSLPEWSEIVLDLGPMYATDVRRASSLNASALWCAMPT